MVQVIHKSGVDYSPEFAPLQVYTDICLDSACLPSCERGLRWQPSSWMGRNQIEGLS